MCVPVALEVVDNCNHCKSLTGDEARHEWRRASEAVQGGLDDHQTDW